VRLVTAHRILAASSDPDAQQVAEDLSWYLVGACSLDAALGLDGPRDPRDALRFILRDDAVRALGKRMTASAIAIALERYYAGEWRHTRDRLDCPHRDPLRAGLWKALRLGGGRALGLRQIQRIIAT
jgi:hypothetical protein